LSATAFAAQPPVGADTQAGAPAPADTPTPSPTTAPAPLPSFEQLQAAGTLIGEIRIVTQDVFDLDDPRESGALYRGANALHLQTRASTVRRALLFSSGEPVSASVIRETERLLRSERYLYDARIVPVALRDNVVDVEVRTRDTWSLFPTISVSRSGGKNKSEFAISELNLAGTGSRLKLGTFKDVDRDGKRIEFSNDNALGRRVALGFALSDNSDGSQKALAIQRPFYALDAHWAAGLSASDEDKLEPVYNAGDLVAEYRRRTRLVDVFGGLSDGRVNGWVRRTSIGLSVREETYAIDAGRTPPARLPADETLIGPYLRWDLIEDRFVELQNRNQMGRSEFFALGLAATLQLGWAAESLGSTRDTLLYELSLSRGFEPTPAQTLVGTLALEGQFADGSVRQQQIGLRTQYFVPHARRFTFYAALSADVLTHPDADDDVLYLGGDVGLRGYPLRFQSGTRRTLLTLEERLYTGAFPWRLIRIGAAVFFDVGRAWGGPNVNRTTDGWLANVGVGFRLFSVRTAESNVVHIDVARPLVSGPGVDGVQVLLSGKSRF
jgi:hypothetical protein